MRGGAFARVHVIVCARMSVAWALAPCTCWALLYCFTCAMWHCRWGRLAVGAARCGGLRATARAVRLAEHFFKHVHVRACTLVRRSCASEAAPPLDGNAPRPCKRSASSRSSLSSLVRLCTTCPAQQRVHFQASQMECSAGQAAAGPLHHTAPSEQRATARAAERKRLCGAIC
jgi:hypothetical protein